MTDVERRELISYRLSKSKDTLTEISLHIENELWNTAVNRIYYACFYAVSALLLSIKVNAQTHSGVRRMFGLHFIKNGLIEKELGKFYSDIFDKRQTGDYDDFVEFKKEEEVSLSESTGLLIKEISNYLSDK